MRGRRCVSRSMGRRWRLIPAGAGQTRWSALGERQRWAHPRRCGADDVHPHRVWGAGGSSPQVRGRRLVRTDSLTLPGLIPAGAGQTHWAGCAFAGDKAHPRRCGADLHEQLRIGLTEGSSPQVRGRLRQGAVVALALGLIPAGAGQTIQTCGSVILREAHPRRCGADGRKWLTSKRRRGSSPQVRGRLGRFRHQTHRNGLIPAGAGQTLRNHLCHRQVLAHPRRCGADALRVYSPGQVVGSSPQVRGRHLATFDDTQGAGLIPAGAGQTLGDQQRCTG